MKPRPRVRHIRRYNRRWAGQLARSSIWSLLLATALLAGAAAVAGCGKVFTPEVGGPLGAECNDTDSDPGVTVSFQRDIQPLFDESCASCHTPEGRSPIGLQVGLFNVSTYTSVRAGGAVRGQREVVPGRPCASGLVQKVSLFPPFGARMPLNGPPFLEDDEIQLLHDWIAEGALEN